MYNEDIFLELMKHMYSNLKSFSLSCKLAYQTYKNNKSTLLDYKNYRFSPFQHSLINTLANKTKEPLLLHTYNNKGKKSAIIMFSLLYNQKINIITNKNEYDKWYKEYNQVANDYSLLIFDKLNHKNYNILITTDLKKQHDVYIFYKIDRPYVNNENYVYVDKYNITQKIKHIHYPYTNTCNKINLICDKSEKKLNELFNEIHFNHFGPYLVIGTKSHAQAYMIQYMSEHKKKIRPNTIYFVTYDKFITNIMYYDKFKTIICLWPEATTTLLLSQTNEKIKSYNDKNMITIYYAEEGKFVEKAIINLHIDYTIYGVKMTTFPINTNTYMQIIHKLLFLHGDRLNLVPDDYFVLLMYVCKDDLQNVIKLIDNYIKYNL